jgi:hypothetical protein
MRRMGKADKVLLGLVVVGMLGPAATVLFVRQVLGWFSDSDGWLFGQPGGGWLMFGLIALEVALLFLLKTRPMTRAEAWCWGLSFFFLQGPLLALAILDTLNVAFAVSCVLLFAMVLIVFLYGLRRPIGTPLTWGEAFVAGAFVFAMLILIYGVVPNQFLFWADNELKWRADSIGIPNPNGERFFSEGIDLLGFLGPGRGRIIVPAEVVRDIIVTQIYVFGLAGNLILWSWWQKRTKDMTETTEVESTSAYGRPVVRQA